MSAASNAKTVELFRDLLTSVRRVGVLGTMLRTHRRFRRYGRRKRCRMTAALTA
jgi:hypothetical protein